MSATNKTTNYELPQFIASDVPSWLNDINGAMSKIDTTIKSVSAEAEQAKITADASSSASNANTTATQTLSNKVTQNTSDITIALARGTWKYLGSAISATPLTLPGDYDEVCIVARNGLNAGLCETITIPKLALTNTNNSGFNFGVTGTSNMGGHYGRFALENNAIKLTHAYTFDGTSSVNVLASTALNVYYR